MIGAFRVERLIAGGSLGAVYEATQPSLGRTVALRLIPADRFATPEHLDRFDDQQRRLASLHHPNLVSFYEAGEWEGGRFVASRFIRGAKLADLQDEGLPLPTAALESVAGALRAGHQAGLVHGRVSADNILVDATGTAYLTDLGLGRNGTPEADLGALAGVISEFETRASSSRGRKRRRLVLALAVATVIAIASLVLTLGGDDRTASFDPAPASLPKTFSVGSSLPPVATTPLGCIENPTANTPECALAQTRLDSATIVVPRAGVIRGWAVRGASGEVSLRVIRDRGGASFLVGFSQPEQVADSGAHAFAADISVGAGDRIGVGLSPGATIGTRESPDAEIARWDGRLTADPRPPTAIDTGVELMIRADVALKAQATGPRQITGSAAATAPPGAPLNRKPMPLPVAGGVEVVVVSLPGEIAIDVNGDERLARLTVPDADPRGELLELARSCGPAVSGGFCLRWRNPDDQLPLEHEYRVRSNGRIEVIG